MTTKKLKVINLFAGPGASKSTTRAVLFGNMKYASMNVEETTEYAKDLTWEDSTNVLSDQLFVIANQNRRLDRLRNKVEWVVTDSPLLLSIHYASPDYLPANFNNMVFELWDTYENYNFLLNRVKPYNPIGRSQTLEESTAIDGLIEKMLMDKHLPFWRVDGDQDAPMRILDILVSQKVIT